MPCGLIGMYLVKCKQSNSHTSLTTLCSHFLLSYGNQTMTKYAHWCSWFFYFEGEPGGGEIFWGKKIQTATQRPRKVHFYHISKYVVEMGIMNDLEWPMFSYYVFCYEKFRKVMKRTEKEALMRLCVIVCVRYLENIKINKLYFIAPLSHWWDFFLFNADSNNIACSWVKKMHTF